MQTHKKRSFLKRLMGLEGEEMEMQEMAGDMRYAESEEMMVQNNDYSPIQPIQGYGQPENVLSPTYSNQNDQVATPIQMETKPVAGNNEGDSNWVADQEGQLTIDVYQTDSDIVIKSTIAGVRPEDLDIQINNDMVTIRGERRKEEETREEDYYYQECYWGAFSRSIILPVDIQANKAEAIMKNGILTIRLPKAETAKARKIQVRGY